MQPEEVEDQATHHLRFTVSNVVIFHEGKRLPFSDLIGGGSLNESAADGWRRRQGIVEANANELGTWGDQPGDLPGRGFGKKTGYREIVSMQVVRAHLDERCDIRVTAKMRGHGHAAVDRRQK